jgi:hypothetical protein
MSIIASKISVDKSVIVGRIDSPLDARTRCNNTADFPNIETPFIGMIIFTTDDRQYWVVTELQAKLIGSQMIEKYQINLLHTVNLGELLQKSNGELTLCYPHNAASLWSIAKQYGEPMETIRAKNSVSETNDISKKKFLII